MELVSSLVLISVVIIGVTQFIKYLAPNVNGAWTILVAVAVGVLIAVFDQFIGATDISIAEGVIAGFGAVGATTGLSLIGNKTQTTTETVVVKK